jgi:hypothetical protein
MYLAARCDRGNQDACQSFNSIQKDRDCQSGNAQACEEVLRPRCQAGEEEACERLSAIEAGKKCTEGDAIACRAAEFSRIASECRNGYEVSCHAMYFIQCQGGDAQACEQSRLAACKSGNQQACVDVPGIRSAEYNPLRSNGSAAVVNSNGAAPQPTRAAVQADAPIPLTGIESPDRIPPAPAKESLRPKTDKDTKRATQSKRPSCSRCTSDYFECTKLCRINCEDKPKGGSACDPSCFSRCDSQSGACDAHCK